jgi:hypothetical protein
VQALANLARHSAAHAAAAWRTALPRILRGLQRGTLANDTADNVPYGSPDAVALARVATGRGVIIVPPCIFQ